MQKSYMQKTADVKRDWHVFDAQNQVLGRFAVEVAKKLIGKDKKEFTPHIDGGDYVVVINAKDIAVTGTKEQDKRYYRHSGYPGNLKSQNVAEVRAKYPERLIMNAVSNMLPKNKLRAERMRRLKVYAGEEHPHQSQLDK